MNNINRHIWIEEQHLDQLYKLLDFRMNASSTQRLIKRSEERLQRLRKQKEADK